MAIVLQGTSPALQGGTSILQGSSPVIQGSSPNLQPTVAPTNNQTLVSSTPAPKATTTTTTTPTDPNAAADAAAAQAAAAKQTQINQAINFGTSNAIAAGTAGTTSAAGSLNEAGAPDIAAVQNGEDAINLAREQIGTTQINTIRQLQNTIKNGLFGTGVQLGNSGALDSSAATAAARAYANYGDVETNAANNTAATGNIAQNTQQTELNNTATGYVTSLKAARDSAVAEIQGNAIAALNNLGTLVSVYLGGDASAINAPSIEAQIIQSAQDQLDQVDQNLVSTIQGITPESTQQVATNAEAASNAGTVPASGAPYQPPTAATGAPSTLTSGGAPPPSLIPLTVGPVSGSNNQDLIPGA